MTVCPFCGAYSIQSCELIDDAGCCPWEEAEEEGALLDPDRLRDDRDERQRLAAEYLNHDD